MKTAAIIGISHYARHHLLMALEQMLQGRLRLVAATVVNQEEEAFFCRRLRGLGCEIFSDVGAMWAKFAGRVDLCFIPTGLHLHAGMTLQALQAGANVLVEKPLAASLVQAQEIMRCERTSGRFVAVGFQDLYTDSTWDIKQLLLDGGIGQLRGISLVGLWPRAAAYYTRNDWAGRLTRDGQPVHDSPINNAFAHFLNLALFWAGSDLAASAHVERLECELYRTQAIESFDTCCARAALSGGVQLRFYATHSCHEERVPRLRLEGTLGSLEWEQESHYKVLRLARAVSEHPVPGKFETKLMMADAVMARLEGRPARICTTAIASEHTRLIGMIHAAASIVPIGPRYLRRRETATGKWTELRDIESASDQADAQKSLWSELGVPWAQPATLCLGESAPARGTGTDC